MEKPASPAARADYGLDAPGVVRNLLIAGAIGLLLGGTTAAGLWSGKVAGIQLGWTGVGWGTACMAMGLWMVWDWKVGKVREREKLLDLLPWTGNETVLDVGCGRGVMLIGAARRLSSGRAIGIDIWQQEDLSGNQPEATLENARHEGVADRVEVRTADMRDLPFADGTFDVAVSNVAIHNIYDRAGRAKALAEVARVLKPGGRVLIADVRHRDEYARALAGQGLTDIQNLGSGLLAWVLGLLTLGSVGPFVLRARKPGVGP